MERTKTFVSTLLLAIAILSLLPTLGTVTVQSTPNSQKFWALLVSCARPGETSLHATGAYMYHVLSEHYDFDGIYYLHSDPSFPGVNDTATLENTKSAITGWLYNVSGPNDVVFIFFNTHGSGYYDNGNPENPHQEDMGSRSGDDGDDTRDEALAFWNGTAFEKYWDDDLAADLANETFSYDSLVLATQSCFGGGLIYDIQAQPRNEHRAILTATSEQLTAYTNLDNYKDPPEEDGYCEWSEVFIDALHGEDTYWDDDSNEVVHQNATVDADFNNDGHVTIGEAWNYTTFLFKPPWTVKDDAMNSTFIEEVKDWWPTPELPIPDYAVPEKPWISNSALAYDIWFPKSYHLTVETCNLEYQEIPGSKVWINGDQTEELSPTTVEIREGNYTVKVEMGFYSDSVHYQFAHWEDNSTSNERFLGYVDSNMTVRAYYRVVPSGGCPFVYTWNGQEYVIDNNILPFSEASGGTDVVDYYALQQTLLPQHSIYGLMIGEFENEHSYLDEIRLLAVDHKADVHVAVTPTGQIFTYGDPREGVSAFSNNGDDVLDLLTSIDGHYYEGHTGDFIVLDFGQLDTTQGAKLVLRADPPPEAGKWSIFVQVRNANRLWDTVAIVMPRIYWATEIVDLSSWLPDADGDLKVRLLFTNTHRVDYVGLDTTPQESYTLRQGVLLWAIHSEQGSVGRKLRFEDEIYAELLPGQTIRLTFHLRPRDHPEAQRTFIVYSKGHYYTIQ